jgi:hypothetical protein
MPIAVNHTVKYIVPGICDNDKMIIRVNRNRRAIAVNNPKSADVNIF